MKQLVILLLSLPILFSCNGKETKQTVETANATALTPEDTTLFWADFRIGEQPPYGYYAALDSIIKKWNIRYQRTEAGCEATEQEKQRHEAGNQKYFRQLEKKYGKNWRQRFDKEVEQLDSILKKQGIEK